MKRFSFFGALALLIVVQSPFIFSYSCEGIPEEIKEACLEISDSSLSESEKYLVITKKTCRVKELKI